MIGSYLDTPCYSSKHEKTVYKTPRLKRNNNNLKGTVGLQRLKWQSLFPIF